MRIGLYYLKSEITNNRFEEVRKNSLNKLQNSNFEIVNQGLVSKQKQIKELNPDIYLLYILTGGTESLIKKFESYDTPVVLKTNSKGNSLPSAIEAREYLRGKVPLEIIHENPTLEKTIMDKEMENLRKNLKGKIGSIGGPSNWLIASNVKKNRLKDFGIEEKHIPTKRIIEKIRKTEVNSNKAKKIIEKSKELENNVSKEDVQKTTKIYKALKDIIEEEKLNSITVRCIDLIKEVGTTFCLPLSLLNDEGIVAGCEGDPRSLFGMMIGKTISDTPTYMGNLADYDKNSITLSHCTIPLELTNSFSLHTHYETNSGVSIRGNIRKKKVTIFGLDNNLKNAVITEGTIINTEEKKDMCRTQLKISVKNPSKYVENAFGNHQIVTFAQKPRVNKFLEYIGIKTC